MQESVAKPSLADEFEDDIDKEIFSDVLIEDVANTSYGEIRSVKCPKDSKQVWYFKPDFLSYKCIYIFIDI